jgi:pyruvate dehydrogenase (quinone)
MVRTVADQLAETLAAAGVKRVYGIVGDSLNGRTDKVFDRARSNLWR